MHSSQKLLLKKQKVLNSERRERSGVYVSFLKDSPKIGKVFLENFGFTKVMIWELVEKY